MNSFGQVWVPIGIDIWVFEMNLEKIWSWCWQWNNCSLQLLPCVSWVQCFLAKGLYCSLTFNLHFIFESHVPIGDMQCNISLPKWSQIFWLKNLLELVAYKLPSVWHQPNGCLTVSTNCWIPFTLFYFSFVTSWCFTFLFHY